MLLAILDLFSSQSSGLLNFAKLQMEIQKNFSGQFYCSYLSDWLKAHLSMIVC